MKRKFRPEPEWPSPCVDLCVDQVEPGVWIGQLVLGDYEYPSFHVEFIELEGKSWHTIDARYQERLDHWLHENSDEKPKVLEIGARRFFIHIEAYAQ
jgi:hypothetical protein